MLRCEHPCVFINESVTLSDPLLLYGYTPEHPDGDPITAVSEDWAGINQTVGTSRLIKFKEGQIQPGTAVCRFSIFARVGYAEW